MIELKSGETYNGILKAVDKFMNIKMENAYLTDPKAEVFHSVGEVWIRGNVIKYFFMDDSAIKKIEGTEYKAPEKFHKGDSKNFKRNRKELDKWYLNNLSISIKK